MALPTPFQINGRSFGCDHSSTIIEAADRLGIYIPRFCYHKKLSVVANCRMCLVEIEGLAKPVPACATQITPDMHILTRSEKTRSAQRAVMEFLLINHPLDCPICDQGGQCELQDLAMRYGRDHSEFNESKRAVSDPNLGPLMATEMTRCIQCTRCVRFGTEVAGQMELGSVGRGEHMKITTYVQQHLKSELAGNMIDVCPVGALTSKPFRFKARAWELRSVPSIAPHDCLGSHLYAHVHDQKVMRVVPRENESINEVWLSDRDRYSYLGITSPKRLLQPMVKKNREWQATDWSTALKEAAQLLQKIGSSYGTKQLGGLISPSATLEEMFLFQKLCRDLKTPHIDHRLHEMDTSDQQFFPSVVQSEIAINELDTCKVIVLIGSNVQREQPLLVSRLRKVVAKGGCIISLNCMDYPFSFDAEKLVIPPTQLVTQLQMLATYCGDSQFNVTTSSLNDTTQLAFARRLLHSKKTAILLGAVARNHPQASHLRYWAEQLRNRIGAKMIYLTEGANATGAWVAGAVPHRNSGGVPLAEQQIGLSAYEMMQARLKSYLLFNVEPDLDCANPHIAQAAIADADCVISFSVFTSKSLLESAHVLLPIHTFGENAGTVVNVEGKWQHFDASIPGMGESRPGWKVLQALSTALNLEDKKDKSLSSLRSNLTDIVNTEATTTIKSYAFKAPEKPSPVNEGQSLWRITEWPLYSIDSLTRNTEALQQSGSHEQTGAYIHPACLKRLALKNDQLIRLRQGEAISAPLPVFISLAVPENCVWTPAGRLETANLGPLFGSIAIERV